MAPETTDKDTADAGAAPQGAAPVLRVVNADATPAEIAALVAVFAALDGGEAPKPRRAPSQWSAPERSARRTLPHGVGGWRSSGLPR